LAIYAKDLGRRDLWNLIEAVRLQKIRDLKEILETDFLEADKQEAAEHIELLFMEKYTDLIVKEYHEIASELHVVDGDFLRREIFSRDGYIVIETSHGLLTDRYYGFAPHTSRLRTIPNVTMWDLFDEYDGDVVKLLVTRAYQIRHGAGPMVTDGYGAIGRTGILEGESGKPDRYRGEVRVGSLDCVALRYGIEVCGGPQAFDGLAITWFDRVAELGEWDYCTRYQNAVEPEFFTTDGGILVRRGADQIQLNRQEQLAKHLQNCRPIIESHPLPTNPSRAYLKQLCAETLYEQLKIPVRMISFGPAIEDKELL